MVGASMVKGEMMVRYQCEAVGLARGAESVEGIVRQEACLRCEEGGGC